MNPDPFIAVIGVALILSLVIYGLPFVYGYRVVNHRIEIVLFHALPIYRIFFDDIELVQKTSWSELGLGGGVLRFGNRFARQCVLIKRRTGLFRRVVITPADADTFINELSFK